MALKDQTGKTLIGEPDVFADIANALLFAGKTVIKPEELTPSHVDSAFLVNHSIASQIRDIKMHWKNGDLRLACIGIENESGVGDENMPLRVIAADAAEYRDQLRMRKYIKRKNADTRRKQKHTQEILAEIADTADTEDFTDSEKEIFEKLLSDNKPFTDAGGIIPIPPLYPVVTLVLNFHNSHSRITTSLKDCLNIPAGLDDLVSDYTINLFEVGYLPPEVTDKMKSDFRYIAKYMFHNRKDNPDRKEPFDIPRKDILHLEEFAEFLYALSGDEYVLAWGKETIDDNHEKGDITMDRDNCFTYATDRAFKDGAASRQQEVDEANQKLQKRNEEIVRIMLKKAYSLEDIISISQVAGSRIREIAKEMKLSIVG